MRKILVTSGLIFMAAMTPANAGDITVRVNAITAGGVGQDIGFIRAVDVKGGLMLVPRLTGLAPGAHGFHVHQNADCRPKTRDGQAVAGLSAGGHFDPASAGKHEGPKGQGHLGDLPPLMVDGTGAARKTVVAPRLTVAMLKGRAIVIHAGGDNFSDSPKALGGGGARIACAVIR
ncbi:MAG: superoxide dismutase [Cu-Zn] SodC [Proteobacteria bacterium]|nr:superoxide dismutase [Cu-Zn] SodC [Pseudomonadota bacterium]